MNNYIQFAQKSLNFKGENWPGHHHYKRKYAFIISLIVFVGIIYRNFS